MIEVVGFGLAGACVALRLLEQGEQVSIVDDGKAGSTMVAAGLVNPVAGRNFEPSWEVERYWKIAKEFYQKLDATLYQPLPILRLWRDEKDRAKFERKREQLETWIHSVDDEGVTWKGGGWLDTRRFLQLARCEIEERGGKFVPDSREVAEKIFCTGAKGLLAHEFLGMEHRSAKGEILTLRISGLNEARILNRGGWLIPLGEDRYRVGATYEWDELETGPTSEGREKVEGIVRGFTDKPFEVEEHVAGIRPIISRSKPVIHHEPEKGWMLNGLGSKGVIYAPGAAGELVASVIKERQ